MTARDDSPAARRQRRHRAMLWFFAVVIFMAAVAFGFKFYEFFMDLARQEGFRFAGAHLLTYLLVAAGFFLLLGFAFVTGHFADIEQPKHDMLEQERRYDAEEFE
jgi:hypothetical protein